MKLEGKKGEDFWLNCEEDQDYKKAIARVKEKLKEAITLTIPNARDKFILTTDASKEGIGCVLSQIQNGGRKGCRIV